MKRRYGVICLDLTPGRSMGVVLNEVFADNEEQAGDVALQIMKKAKGIENCMLAPALGTAKSIQDYGPATAEELAGWARLCARYGIEG